MKMIKKVLIISALLLAVVVSLLVYNDILKDQRHKIEIIDKTPVYANWEPYPRNEQPLFSVTTTDIVRVKRIRYGKDYMTIKIETEKGQSGWVFYGPTVRIQYPKNT